MRMPLLTVLLLTVYVCGLTIARDIRQHGDRLSKDSTTSEQQCTAVFEVRC